MKAIKNFVQIHPGCHAQLQVEQKPPANYCLVGHVEREMGGRRTRGQSLLWIFFRFAIPAFSTEVLHFLFLFIPFVASGHCYFLLLFFMSFSLCFVCFCIHICSWILFLPLDDYFFFLSISPFLPFFDISIFSILSCHIYSP